MTLARRVRLIERALRAHQRILREHERHLGGLTVTLAEVLHAMNLAGTMLRDLGRAPRQRRKRSKHGNGAS